MVQLGPNRSAIFAIFSTSRSTTIKRTSDNKFGPRTFVFGPSISFCWGHCRSRPQKLISSPEESLGFFFTKCSGSGSGSTTIMEAIKVAPYNFLTLCINGCSVCCEDGTILWWFLEDSKIGNGTTTIRTTIQVRLRLLPLLVGTQHQWQDPPAYSHLGSPHKWPIPFQVMRPSFHVPPQSQV